MRSDFFLLERRREGEKNRRKIKSRCSLRPPLLDLLQLLSFLSSCCSSSSFIAALSCPSFGSTYPPARLSRKETVLGRSGVPKSAEGVVLEPETAPRQNSFFLPPLRSPHHRRRSFALFDDILKEQHLLHRARSLSLCLRPPRDEDDVHHARDLCRSPREGPAQTLVEAAQPLLGRGRRTKGERRCRCCCCVGGAAAPLLLFRLHDALDLGRRRERSRF